MEYFQDVFDVINKIQSKAQITIEVLKDAGFVFDNINNFEHSTIFYGTGPTLEDGTKIYSIEFRVSKSNPENVLLIASIVNNCTTYNNFKRVYPDHGLVYPGTPPITRRIYNVKINKSTVFVNFPIAKDSCMAGFSIDTFPEH